VSSLTNFFSANITILIHVNIRILGPEKLRKCTCRLMCNNCENKGYKRCVIAEHKPCALLSVLGKKLKCNKVAIKVDDT